MKILIIAVIVFVVIIYLYTYIKYKKRKQQKIDTVGDYKRTYLRKNTEPQNPPSNDGYTNYMTKYNSKVDYIEKEAFLNEASDPDRQSAKPTPKKPKF